MSNAGGSAALLDAAVSGDIAGQLGEAVLPHIQARSELINDVRGRAATCLHLQGKTLLKRERAPKVWLA